MESTQSIINKYCDEIFSVVALVYSNGGGQHGAKDEIKEKLYMVWNLSRKQCKIDFSNTLKDKINMFVEKG